MFVCIYGHSFPRSGVAALLLPVRANNQNIPFFHQYMPSCAEVRDRWWAFV